MRLCTTAFILPMLIALAWQSGCASSHLKVTVSVYADDPLLQSLSDPRRLEAIRSSINDAEQLTDEVAASRIEGGDDLIDLYRAYYRITDAVNLKLGQETNESDEEKAIQQLQDDQAESNAEIERRRKLSHDRVAEARMALESLARISDQWRKTKLRSDAVAFLRAIDELEMTTAALSDAMCKLIELNTVFDEEMRDAFNGTDPVNDPGMPGELKASMQRKDLELTTEIKSRIEDLINLVQNMIDEAGRRTIKNAFALSRFQAGVDSLNSASNAGDAGRVGALLQDTARNAYDTTANPGFKEAGQMVIRDVGISGDFYTSQLDRIQDPADPAWRLLSDPSYGHLWHQVFAKAEFYAEGKSEVIFVQDRIGHFRVQRGQNNPSALILGQSRISRAIAAGALNAFAAASGVSGLPGLPKAGTMPDEAPPASKSDGNDASAKLSASSLLAANSDRMSRERQALLKQLRQSRARIAATKSDDGDPATTDDGVVTPEIYQQLKALVDAYSTLFSKPPSDSNGDAK